MFRNKLVKPVAVVNSEEPGICVQVSTSLRIRRMRTYSAVGQTCL